MNHDAQAGMQASILLVEDSPTQAMKLQYKLEQQGHRVHWVDSAESALAVMAGQRPDLVICDLHLPGISGEEFCRRMRIGINTRATPVLLLTGLSGAAVEARALESGADDFVSKTDDEDMLLLRVDALLRKSNVRDVLASARTRVGSIKVLVVEDSATYRQLLVDELSRDGYRLVEAGTGEQALAQLAQEPFDAVVLDLVLPDIGGAEVCRRMVQSRRTVDNTFMVLALTGQESRQDMSDLLAAGADDVMGKSRDMDVIRARLRALVRRKLMFDENRAISREFQERERELLQERAERQVAETRAALVGELERANRELRETQAQLVQSAKMASLGQLVAGIAHEINNPAAFVIAHVQTVQRLLLDIGAEAAPALSEDGTRKLAKATQRLADIGVGMDRVRDLVVKLRTFSRLDEGEHKPSSVRENVDSVLLMLRHRTKGRIDVTCHIDARDVIPCYPGLLNQALMNLVSNAIDAIEGPGQIDIVFERGNDSCMISVQDSGKGIAPELHERVCEPFFTTKPVGQGTGLGMSITWQIVQRHRGRMKIHSEPGRGTRIEIALPLAQELKTDGTQREKN